MSRMLRGLPIILLLASFYCVLGFARPERPVEPAAASKSARPGQEFAGQDVCAGCHIVQDVQVQKTPHATDPDRSDAVGCEGCHGAGGAHVDAMFAAGSDADVEAARQLVFAFDGSPAENAATCLGCHQGGRETRNFDHSEHQLNGVACQTCHSAHLEAAEEDTSGETLRRVAQGAFSSNRPSRREEGRWLNESLLRASEPGLCYSCHATIASQFALPTHHRVPEGLMTCTSCHEPHGGRSQPMLRSVNWETCVNCHVEKRGPFVYEHAPVKVEGCIACHTPHGSVNRMLLVRREGRFTCLQCHVDPFAPNVPHGRLGFQTRGECVRCHATVHGSNSSPFFLN